MTMLAPSQPEMKISLADTTTQDEMYLSRGEDGVDPRYGKQMFVSYQDGDSFIETVGTKLNQRSEYSETTTSQVGNQSNGDLWYGFSIYVDPTTALPTVFGTGPEANIVIFQFHERPGPLDGSVPPPIVFELTENGDIVALFGTGVGKREYVLVEGGAKQDAAMGKWIDFAVRADWRTDDQGQVEFHVRHEGEADYTLKALDIGVNTTTDNIYLKYGVYRNFLDRDPLLQESPAKVYYDGLMRGQTMAEVTTNLGEGAMPGTDFDDLLLGSKTDEFLFGLDGNDTIRGKAGDDWIDGGDGADLLRGGLGNDTLLGGNGADQIYGGKGNDLLGGGNEADILKGRAGDDTLLGGSGDDQLFGNGGADVLDGGTGNDTLLGGGGRDTLTGGFGSDTLSGGNGRDVLSGGNAGDVLDGGKGRDTLDGGANNDQLIGGRGADTMTGGTGFDMFIWRKDDLNGRDDTITDFQHNAVERDRLDLTDLNILALWADKASFVDAALTWNSAKEAAVLELDMTSRVLLSDWQDLGETMFLASVEDGLLL